VPRKTKKVLKHNLRLKYGIAAGIVFATCLGLLSTAKVQLYPAEAANADTTLSNSTTVSAKKSATQPPPVSKQDTDTQATSNSTESGTPSKLIKELDTPQATAPASTATPPPPPQDTYQINEQFSGTSLNSSLWEMFTAPKGYRNNEEQDYSPSQVRVADGSLQITAAKDAQGNWHSGEVYSKWNYTYGEFEVRMALSASGPGVWPAAWLMGTVDDWPSNGEIDMMENINGDSTIYGTIHGGNSQPWQQWSLGAQYSPINVTQFHTYKIVKQPGVISWYIDGVKHAEWHQSDMPAGPYGNVWPFENHRNFGLLDLAIGGNWPQPSNSSTPNPIVMYVDYFTVKNGS